MAEQPNKPAPELIAELERRTKALAVGKLALLIVVVIGLAWLIASNYRLQTQNATLQTQQKKTLDSIAKNATIRTQQISDLQHHIDCIVDLFAQPNHNSISIQDVSTCKLNKDGSLAGATSSTKSGSVNAPTAATTPRSPASQNSPAPAQNGHPAPQPAPTAPAQHTHPLVCTLTLGLVGCRN